MGSFGVMKLSHGVSVSCNLQPGVAMQPATAENTTLLQPPA